MAHLEFERYTLLSMRQPVRPFFSALWLLLLPLAEYIGLRFFQHGVLNLRVGWPVGTDYDLALPLIWVHVFGLVFLFVGVKPEIKLQKKTFLLNLVSFAVLFFLTDLIAATGWRIEGLLKGVWAFSCAAVFLSAYFCFLSPRYFLSHPKKKIIPLLVGLTFSMFLFRWGFGGVWHYLAEPTGEMLRLIALPLVGAKVSPTFNASQDILLIPTKEITLLIGRGCSGGEGLLVFLLCCTGFALHSRKRSLNQWLLFIPLGIFTLLALNVARLSLLLFIGVFLVRAGIYSREFFLFWIHANLGWLLYVCAMYPLFYLFANFETGAFRFTRRHLVGSSLTVVLILSSIFVARTAYPANCNQACATAADCVGAGCPICVGVCTGCATQGDSTSCADVGSGASTYCTSVGGACVDVPEVEGIQKFGLYLLAFLGIVALIPRTRMIDRLSSGN